MSEYCCLIAKKETVVLAESNYKENVSYSKRIMPLISKMSNGTLMDFIDIEMEKSVCYFLTTNVILACVGSIHIKDRLRRFLEKLVVLLNREFGNIEGMLATCNKITKHCLQERLEVKFNKLMNDFETGIYDRSSIAKLNADVSEMRGDLNKHIRSMFEHNNNLNELLVVSQKIHINADEFKANAKNLEYESRFLKPWMIYTLVVIVVAVIAYLIFALARCGNLNIICQA